MLTDHVFKVKTVPHRKRFCLILLYLDAEVLWDRRHIMKCLPGAANHDFLPIDRERVSIDIFRPRAKIRKSQYSWSDGQQWSTSLAYNGGMFDRRNKNRTFAQMTNRGSYRNGETAA